MKWLKGLLKQTRLTREYTGGTIAGVGVGVVLYEMFLRRASAEIPYSALVVGFVLIMIGSSLARSGQRQQQECEKASEPDAAADADKPRR